MKKKDVIPTDTRYVPLTQQPYCCVPTCIQMIMLRHKIPLRPAELIAHHLYVVVSPEKSKQFWNLPVVAKRPTAGWGTGINEDKTLNNMFKSLKIPLRAKFRLIDTFENSQDLSSYLQMKQKEDSDVIICYDYGTLFNTDKHSGHTGVFDLLDLAKGEVRLMEPDYGLPKWRAVKLSKLYKSMKAHGPENVAGCWEISKI